MLGKCYVWPCFMRVLLIECLWSTLLIVDQEYEIIICIREAILFWCQPYRASTNTLGLMLEIS